MGMRNTVIYVLLLPSSGDLDDGQLKQVNFEPGSISSTMDNRPNIRNWLLSFKEP
jgi:hypothetical protein